MDEKIRVVHYLNQFFAQIGGEERADIGPGFKEGPIGPGRALQQTLGQQGEVVATCFCGDNYFAEHLEEATEELLGQMANFKPQLLIAGPAFESGRYGVACGAIGQAAQERLSIPAVAGMDAENAGTGVYRKKVYIVDSGSSVVRMAQVLQRMTALGLKLVQGMPLEAGRRRVFSARHQTHAFASKPPGERAVDMLLAKIRGEPFESEIATPQFHHIKPAAAVRDLSSAVIALVTDGGLVTEGNPERMEPGRPTRFTTIAVEGIDRLDSKEFDVVHSGYDTALANQDPHRLVPLVSCEKAARVIRNPRIHPYYGRRPRWWWRTRPASPGIAERLKSAGVTGVILILT